MTEEAGTISHCNKCGPSTYHDVLALSEADAYTKFMSSRKDDSWNQWYEMLRCRGCGQVSLRCTEGYTSKGYTTTYYPPAIARRTPPWVDYVSWVLFEGNDEVPLDICNIMKEVYIALQNNSRRLCAMGIRATLEHTMIDKIGDHGKFVINLDEFQKAGYLSERQRTALDTIFEAGHAAIHRGWEPTEDDIRTLMDITESVIESVYLHGVRAERLEKVVPKRLPRPKKL